MGQKTLVFFLIIFSFCWQLVVGVTVSEQSSDLSSFGSHFHNFTTIKWLSGTLHRPCSRPVASDILWVCLHKMHQSPHWQSCWMYGPFYLSACGLWQAFIPIDLSICQMSNIDMRLLSSKVGLCVRGGLRETPPLLLELAGFWWMTHWWQTRSCDGIRDAN